MKYGLIGEKLGHSYSKGIHERIGLYSFELKEIAKEDLDGFLKARDFCGINVTIPYKQTVIPYLYEIEEGAAKIGAVNAIVNRDGKLYGYNTDHAGLLTLIQTEQIAVEGKKVVILGTGGTSRTAVSACKKLGAKSIARAGRRQIDPDPSDALLTDVSHVTYEEIGEKCADAEVILNTTPCGMFPDLDGAAVDLQSFPKAEAVIDVIYNPLRTRLCLQAQSRGIRAVCGLKMLVAQAVCAAELFTGKTLDASLTETIFAEKKKELENIVLTGMPGSGKSTVGKLLAKKTGREFVDTDALIVKRDGRQITEIFAQDGEAVFREMERNIALELRTRHDLVIATGGGFMLSEDCERAMKAYGSVFFLDRDPASIRPTADRPLADDPEKIAKLYRERLPKYRRIADHVIEVTGTPESVLAAILHTMESSS